MEEKINNILLLSTDILTYSREIDKNDRESINNFLKILNDFEHYSIQESDIDKLEPFINKITDMDEEINQEDFKKNFIELINSITSQSGFKKEDDNEIQDLKNKINELEKIVQKQESTVSEIDDVSKFYENIHENMLSLNQKLEDVDTKEKILQNIKDYTENKIAKNNFDLLSSGFSTILSSKKGELGNLASTLIFFGILILAIPLLIMASNFYNWRLLLHVSSIISLVTIELFIIYYFKIFLHNYNELKEQILQIDNKQALLGFISNYLKFKDMNSITDNSIEKLEEIIFSKITPDLKQSPMAPDIASIIDKIIKAIKG
ncbi:MAG: hypothetical protein PHS65_01695 [Arcobacteraceae bacterium]|nr:hypothetical protein [Arcobacteraceae bacterium]